MEIKYQAFVSSTYIDLVKERNEVYMAILKAQCIPSGMELFPGWGVKIWPYIRETIDECEFYILIIGTRYGSTDKVRGKPISWTEKEFNYAVSKGKIIIAFLPRQRDPLKIKGFSPIQRRVLRLVKTGKKLSKKDEKVLKLIKDKRKLNQNNTRVLKFIKRVEGQKCLLNYWQSSDDLFRDVSLNLTSYIRSQSPKGGWVKADQIPGLSLVSSSHDRIKEGKDYLKIISIHNKKGSLGGIITRASPLAERLFDAADQNRTVSKMRNQFPEKEVYDSCWKSGAFEDDPSGKISIRNEWGGDYALLYALCYVHKNKLYDSNPSRGGFNLRSIIKDWRPERVDAAIYISLICHHEMLINSLINLPPKDVKNADYPKTLTLIYRIIQLRPSLGNNTQVARILDDVLAYMPQ